VYFSEESLSACFGLDWSYFSSCLVFKLLVIEEGDQIENNEDTFFFLPFLCNILYQYSDFVIFLKIIQTVITNCSAEIYYLSGFCVVVAHCLFQNC